MSFARKIVYSKAFSVVNKAVLGLFYDRKYLAGKFFDEQRYGFAWAWKGIFRSFGQKKYSVRWPVGKDCYVPNGKNIQFDASSLNIFQSHGCYFQNYHGKITIGKDVWIAPNVGIITENHDPANPEKHLEPKDIEICDGCWIGMNAVILPGVRLGPHTTVGAGSVVTHSFDGNCIVVGNPAKVLRTF